MRSRPEVIGRRGLNPIRKAPLGRRTRVKHVTNDEQCIQRGHIDEKILPEHLVSACQSLLYFTQRTARCGSVRRPAAYRVRPGSSRVLAGMAARYGSRNATKDRLGGNTRRAPRTAHIAEAPGNRANPSSVPWQGPSNSYFEGPCSFVPGFRCFVRLPRRVAASRLSRRVCPIAVVRSRLSDPDSALLQGVPVR